MTAYKKRAKGNTGLPSVVPEQDADEDDEEEGDEEEDD